MRGITTITKANPLMCGTCKEPLYQCKHKLDFYKKNK
jgi:hypothetical protein